MKNFWISILSLSAMGAGAAENVPALPTNRVTLSAGYINRLAERLRTNHPAVLAADARVEAAAENVRAVRTWEDPRILLGGVAAREPMRADEGDLIYGVEQRLPLFGKAKFARSLAEAETEVAKSNSDYQFQLRRLDFTKHLLQAAMNDQLAAIAKQDLSWLETLAGTLEQRYQAGQASQLDLLKARNERARQAERVVNEGDHRMHERWAMNIMLWRSNEEAWPSFDLPPVAQTIPHDPRLEGLALRFEPKLRTLRQEIKRDDAAVRMTRRERLPDVTAGVEARNYTGDGSFRQGMFTLAMNVPWANGSKYKAEIAREEAKARASRLDAEDYERSVREQLHRLLVMIDVARREAVLYRDGIIPRSRSGLDAIRASWEAGRGNLTDLFEARRMLLEAQTMYARAVVEQYTGMAELVLSCGLSGLPALESLSQPEPGSPEAKP